MVTAGPTHEKIDPVRFIGNYSSGKMGYAIAEELASQGGEVILVSGPVALQPKHQNITKIDVITADQMYQQCVSVFGDMDGAVMCAAVADFKPLQQAKQKVKRGKDNFTLELTANPDIAAKLGQMKTDGQLLVGFALETSNEKQNANKKLRKKNLDFIVLNSLKDAGAGFQTDTNKISIIGRDNILLDFELKSKSLVAIDIVAHMIHNLVL